jgi:hypothetical protein
MVIILLEHSVCGESNTKSHELTKNIECQAKPQKSDLLLATQTSIRTEKSPNKGPVDISSDCIAVDGTQYSGKNYTECNGDWNYTSDVRTNRAFAISDSLKY